MRDNGSDRHISELVVKFYNISKSNYNGKTFDNVLNIFDELSLEDQKALLRGALGIFAASASGIIHDKELIDYGDAGKLIELLKKLQDEQVKEQSRNMDVMPPPLVATPVHAVAPAPVVSPQDAAEYGKYAGILAVLAIMTFVVIVVSGGDSESLQKLEYLKTFFNVVTFLGLGVGK